MAAQHRRPQHPAAAAVSITKIVNVQPAKKSSSTAMQPVAASSNDFDHKKLLSLSNLDRQCPELMNIVFFYKPSSAVSPTKMPSVFSSLRAGLEETLSVWYPAAGRLVLSSTSTNHADHGAAGGKLDIWCNNAGAVLVEAVAQRKMSELGEDLSQYNEFYENLVYKPPIKGTISEMPLLVAQVTKFSCGGYSVGVGTSHSLFDGPATFNFLSAWACTANNVSSGIRSVGWQKPVHDRGRLLIMNNNNYNNYESTAHHDHVDVVTNNSHEGTTRVAAIEHLYQLITQGLVDNSGDVVGLVNNRQEKKYVLKTFHVTSSMIEGLKRKVHGGHYDVVAAAAAARAGGGSSSSSSCTSTFEALAAHLWKARSRALGLLSMVGKDRMVCLQFSVDTRNRMVPPLPQYFSGNAYVLASVALTAGQLEKATYGFIIEKIKEAKRSVTNDYVSAYIKALEASNQTTLPPINELTLVSDWTRMPLHRVNLIPRLLHDADDDHDDGGGAAVACPLNPPLPQVAYFIQNSRDSKGVDLRIGLSPHTMNAFTRYFLNPLFQ